MTHLQGVDEHLTAGNTGRENAAFEGEPARACRGRHVSVFRSGKLWGHKTDASGRRPGLRVVHHNTLRKCLSFC